MSTLEILIAFAILTLSISAVIMVVFGNQSIAVDTQTNIEALSKAQAQLEEARSLARQDFFSVKDIAPASDDIYEKSLDVQDSECQKKAVSTVSWKQGSRDLHVLLTTVFSELNIARALGGDCDSSPLGDWDNPHTAKSIDFGGSGATDIDAQGGRIYITANPSPANGEDLYIYDFDAIALTLTERVKIDLGQGFNAIDVAKDFDSGETYAYVLEDDNVNQVKVIRVTDPSSPTVVATRTLPNIVETCSPASKPCLAGRSIYVYDDILYVGTGYFQNLMLPTTQNNELHLYDISTPTSPTWLGSANANHNVNSIVVREGYAYLATSGDDREVMVYNVSDPSAPSLTGVFDASGDEDATAVFLLKPRLYVGRVDVSSASERDFYILDVSDSEDDPVELGAELLNLHSGTEIKGIVVKGKLAFLAIDDPTLAFKILNISDPSDIKDHTICTSLNISENTSAIDMDGDFVFTANRSNAELRVLRDQATACI